MSIPAQHAVPNAWAGPISDTHLERGIAAAQAARDECATEAQLALLLMLAAPIMEECLLWRRRMGLIRDAIAADNVIFLPGVPQ